MGKKKTDEKLTAAAEAEKQDALFMEEEERDFDDFGTPPDDLDELTCETPLLDIDFDKAWSKSKAEFEKAYKYVKKEDRDK